MRTSKALIISALLIAGPLAQAAQSKTCSADQITAAFSKATDYYWTNCYKSIVAATEGSAVLKADCEYGGIHLFTMKIDRQCNVDPQSVQHQD